MSKPESPILFRISPVYFPPPPSLYFPSSISLPVVSLSPSSSPIVSSVGLKALTKCLCLSKRRDRLPRRRWSSLLNLEHRSRLLLFREKSFAPTCTVIESEDFLPEGKFQGFPFPPLAPHFLHKRFAPDLSILRK